MAPYRYTLGSGVLLSPCVAHLKYQYNMDSTCLGLCVPDLDNELVAAHGTVQMVPSAVNWHHACLGHAVVTLLL